MERDAARAVVGRLRCTHHQKERTYAPTNGETDRMPAPDENANSVCLVSLSGFPTQTQVATLAFWYMLDEHFLLFFLNILKSILKR